MTAATVPVEPPFGFRIDPSEQGATSTIELAGECGLAQRSARADAIARALDLRPARPLRCLRRPAHPFDSASGDSEGVGDAI